MRYSHGPSLDFQRIKSNPALISGPSFAQHITSSSQRDEPRETDFRNELVVASSWDMMTTTARSAGSGIQKLVQSFVPAQSSSLRTTTNQKIQRLRPFLMEYSSQISRLKKSKKWQTAA
ncbi:hypothetical protein SMAC4_13608 [Sordaria macrospora]|uniref:uncharacterized protein n=1 Tax=Sordaria macrospora TaxID=5147 RepID=UPI002B2BC043|nr:hypothetical protein SMAC4_13608 [Sordaria macrospora]